MSAPPYMKLFWGDYHKATRHLTRDQHGAYFLLIGEAWRLGGSLPDDDVLLARWALCTPEEWAAMRCTIVAFFTPRRGKLQHDRVRAELAKYESISCKRKAAGKTGGIASGGNAKGNQQAIAGHLPTKPESEPESEKKKETLPSGAYVRAREAPFDEFWSAYPNKVGKADARKAYDKAAKRAPHAEIMMGLQRAHGCRKWLEGYIPNPSTWLNQDRWLDQPDETPRAPLATPGMIAAASDELAVMALKRKYENDEQGRDLGRIEGPGRALSAAPNGTGGLRSVA